MQSAYAKRKQTIFTTNQKFLFVNLNTNAYADAIGGESKIYHGLTIPMFNLNCTTKFTYRHKKTHIYMKMLLTVSLVSNSCSAALISGSAVETFRSCGGDSVVVTRDGEWYKSRQIMTVDKWKRMAINVRNKTTFFTSLHFASS